ncbi:MAG TPA: o-succinylbenzoate--CoA ligase [Actinophytocola sp.]|uniref:o-succinylbenzoate--CoA ligase n=1 Tax=Actinophytocola sp. TaxID=1872138 RepID=UPI002DB95A6A|nr:o-succinylbenzoate--CoA ligase [Actinophytocola sp.]HEU5472000.1 o-succinylbenzoate--CoA ligase [Actinophytocola sp.]
MRHVPVDGSPAAAGALLAALRAALTGSGPPVLPLPAGKDRLLAELAPGEPVEPGTALVVATSGSTGSAKGVVLSAAALSTSASATHERLGGPGRWLLALPAGHIAGVQVLVRSVLAGTEPVLLDLSAGFDAAAFAAAAAGMTGRPRYTALVPTQLGRLLAGAGGPALRSFDAVLLGGAPAPAGLLDRARAAGVAVVTTYGMTETAGGCVYAGVPLAGAAVRIGPDGLVQLAGPMLATGYRLRPVETAAAFACGWFRTSDLGRLRPDGTLEVLGRADDLINTGGLKVAPGAVERVLAAQPGVAEACVVGLPDPEWGQRVVAAVVCSAECGPGGGPGGGTGRPDPAALCAAVRAELGPAAVPKAIRFVDRLPLRGPGKVDREAVAASF